MPSKKSKTKTSSRSSLWKHAPSCSEVGLGVLAKDLGRELRAGDRVLLEGPMGAGKSTFARALLEACGCELPPAGSPTFAIAHEYPSPRGTLIHIDVYRLESPSELESAGVESALWERSETIVLTEWLSKFTEEYQSLLSRYKQGRVWRVQLAFDPADESRRSVDVEQVRL